MEDQQIVSLYWARQEAAIAETDRVYGRRLHRLADGILGDERDAQECVSDTYLRTWQTIPPSRPAHFFAYLAAICRHLALDRLDWRNAAKRRAEVVSLTRELEQCLPDPGPERQTERVQLRQALNGFLATLSPENRTIFLRRYWYADTIAQVAGHCGLRENAVKTRLHRIRGKLRNYLEQEGIAV